MKVHVFGVSPERAQEIGDALAVSAKGLRLPDLFVTVSPSSGEQLVAALSSEDAAFLGNPDLPERLRFALARSLALDLWAAGEPSDRGVRR